MRVQERFRSRGSGASRRSFRRDDYDETEHYQRRCRSHDRFRERMDDKYIEESYRNNPHNSKRWEEGVEDDFQDGRGYDRAYEREARGFYTNDPPSANSAVVETIFRKPKVYADLNEYNDSAPMIDRVPTAIGYHSMDSAEEYAEEKSRASRYSYDVRDDGDDEENVEEAAPPIPQVPSPDPDDGDKYAKYLSDATQEHPASTMRSMWSDDSDSCPPVWRSFSEEKEGPSAEWALEQAKRRAALNSVSMPKKRPSAGGGRKQQGAVDDRSSTRRGKSERRDVGSLEHQSQESPRYSDEDSTIDEDDENHQQTSNVDRNGKPKKNSKKKGKRWEAWGYIFNGNGGSVKSKKSDSSKSRSMKSRGSKSTHGSSRKKTQTQSRVAKKAQYNDLAPQKAKQVDNRGGRPVQDNSDEKSGRSIGSAERAKKPTRPIKPDGIQSQTIPQSQRQEKKQVAPVEQYRETEESRRPKTAARETPPLQASRDAAPSSPAAVVPPVPRTVDLAQRQPPTQPHHPSQVMSNDEFIMQVRGEEPEVQAVSAKPASPVKVMDKTEPKDPNKFDGFASMLMSGFDHLANLGLNEPFSFLDWSGEEKEIAKLSQATSSESKKVKPSQRVDAEGAVHLEHPKKVARESQSLTLDGSSRSERRSSRTTEEASEARGSRKHEEDISIYDERRSGHGERESRSGHHREAKELPVVSSPQGERERGSQHSQRNRDSDHPSSPQRRRHVAAAYLEATKATQVKTRHSQSGRNTNAKENESRHTRSSRESREVQSLNLDGQDGRGGGQEQSRDQPTPREQPRESQSSGRSEFISISTIEFPTPEFTVQEEDDGSISILGLERRTKHHRTPSSTLASHAEVEETKEVATARSKKSQKSTTNNSTSNKKGKNSFLGKFIARKKSK